MSAENRSPIEAAGQPDLRTGYYNVLSNRAFQVWPAPNTVFSDPRATVEDPEWQRFDSDDPTDLARWLTDGKP